MRSVALPIQASSIGGLPTTVAPQIASRRCVIAVTWNAGKRSAAEYTPVWSPKGPSTRRSSLSTYPSITKSASAGTSASIESAFAIRTGAPRRKPAKASSSTTGGSGALAAYVSAGSPPIATVTGTRRPHLAACARPCLWRCQCIAAVRAS